MSGSTFTTENEVWDFRSKKMPEKVSEKMPEKIAQENLEKFTQSQHNEKDE